MTMNTTKRASLTAWSSVIYGRGVPYRSQHKLSKFMPNGSRSSDKDAAAILTSTGAQTFVMPDGVIDALERLQITEPQKQIAFDILAMKTLIFTKWGANDVVEEGWVPFARKTWRMGARFEGYEANGERLTDPEICAKYFYLLGHGIWHSNSPTRLRVGSDRIVARFALDISAMLGYQRAHLDLVQLSMLEDRPPPRTSLQAVATAAHGDEDWRATSLYARYLLQFKKDKQSLELAHKLTQQLDQMVAPSNSGTAGQVTSEPKVQFDTPWMLLRDINERLYNDTPNSAKSTRAKYDNEYYDAIMTGVKHWNDPIACQHVANHPLTPEHSEIWVELTSKRAMQGDADATWELAKYYVQTEGWYPGKGARPTGHDADVAIEWMKIAVASSIDDMKKMPGRCVVLALILRESGLPEAGLQEIKDCLKAIKDVKYDTKGIPTAIRQLEEFVDKWNEPDFGTIRPAARFFDRQG